MDDLMHIWEFFGELGVDGIRAEPSWRSRAKGTSSASAASADDGADSGADPGADRDAGRGATQEVRVSSSANESLAGIRENLGDCTRCKLHGLGRQKIVFGVGNPNADLMFVGEAPGADEDKQGEPFVGRAGQLLTKII